MKCFDTVTEITETHTVKTVTGLDGKTYRATPKPKPDKQVAKELALVNDIRLYIRHVGSSKETKTPS